jgi:hypothetical protein
MKTKSVSNGSRRQQFNLTREDMAFLDSLGGRRADAFRRCLLAAACYDADVLHGYKKERALQKLAAVCRLARGVKRQREGAAVTVWTQWVRTEDERLLDAIMARRGFRAKSEAARYSIRVTKRYRCCSKN